MNNILLQQISRFSGSVKFIRDTIPQTFPKLSNNERHHPKGGHKNWKNKVDDYGPEMHGHRQQVFSVSTTDTGKRTPKNGQRKTENGKRKTDYRQQTTFFNEATGTDNGESKTAEHRTMDNGLLSESYFHQPTTSRRIIAEEGKARKRSKETRNNKK
ncbi:hypothetical protein B9Z55_006688 [Caenorhabditis nigoni]|nr:hypothetical protein B9Z55_006688 [Caenorhabditis nigoni]